MRSCLAFISVALMSAALLFGPLPVSAKPSDSQSNFPAELDRLATTLKAQSARALNAASDAATRIIQDGEEAIAEAETDAAQRLKKFREALNERKARLAMIGEDAAARLNAWRQETLAAWLEKWPDDWAKTMSEMHRSATEALDWFRDWLHEPSASDEPLEIPV